MSDLPGDPNLPPGCTRAEIYRNEGLKRCRCGRWYDPDEGEDCPRCIARADEASEEG